MTIGLKINFLTCSWNHGEWSFQHSDTVIQKGERRPCFYRIESATQNRQPLCRASTPPSFVSKCLPNLLRLTTTLSMQDELLLRPRSLAHFHIFNEPLPGLPPSSPHRPPPIPSHLSKTLFTPNAYLRPSLPYIQLRKTGNIPKRKRPREVFHPLKIPSTGSSIILLSKLLSSLADLNMYSRFHSQVSKSSV
jgi:hypothetical protein